MSTQCNVKYIFHLMPYFSKGVLTNSGTNFSPDILYRLSWFGWLRGTYTTSLIKPKRNKSNRIGFNDLGDHYIGIPDPLQRCGKASYRYDSHLLCQCSRAPFLLEVTFVKTCQGKWLLSQCFPQRKGLKTVCSRSYSNLLDIINLQDISLFFSDIHTQHICTESQKSDTLYYKAEWNYSCNTRYMTYVV